MTRASLPSRKLSLAPLLIALAASGCVVPVGPYPQHPSQRPAPGQPHEPPYQPPYDSPHGPPYEEPPHEQPPPADPYQPPEVARCALDAPVLFVVRTAPIQQRSKPFRVLRILDSGAWITIDHGVERTGCLDDGQMSELRHALAMAQFTAAAPQQVTCAALPTMVTTVVDRSRRLRTSYAAPCGQPAHESIDELVRVTGAWTRTFVGQPVDLPAAPPPAPDEPAPPPPVPHEPVPPHAHCALDAPVLYSRTTAALHAQDQPPRTLQILDSGAWILRANGTEHTGCLSPGQMRALRRQMRRADFTPPPPPAFQCKALPVEAVVIEDHTRHRQARYTAPCGTPVHDSIHTLERTIAGWIRIEAQ